MSSNDVREKVVRVMRTVSDELARRGTARVSEEEVAEAVAAACITMGITPQDYARAVEAAPELGELERETLREALAGSTDPGPHDRISRESPSGQPADLHKNRTYPLP